MPPILNRVKIDVSFVSLKEEIPNKSISEILESLPLKTFSSMLQMLLKKNLIFHMKKLGNEGGDDQYFQCLCHSKKLDEAI